MVVECHKCKITVDAIEIASYEVENPYEPAFVNKYSLGKCPKCREPILAVQDTILVFGELDFGRPKVLFPLDDFHINPAIPEILRNALLESIKCYRSSAFTATVILCRRTIEGFAHLKGIKAKTLEKSIKDLKENGVINEQLSEWADELRLSGNRAAHDIESNFSATDARDIMDFTIAILDYSYSLKEKFDSFKQRRVAMSDSKSPKNSLPPTA